MGHFGTNHGLEEGNLYDELKFRIWKIPLYLVLRV